ncbi:hypothetical protein CMEL01_06794 [Colletotrichum melonis]|uniref:Secreted protein n=1 Tax=Colletotrichum melonis TaxID=1209925 RepID=A0AAI9U9B7_9PEZI|nr:hypothetical protein CMEL01_06794 [Colletotrichum melonis]
MLPCLLLTRQLVCCLLNAPLTVDKGRSLAQPWQDSPNQWGAAHVLRKGTWWGRYQPRASDYRNPPGGTHTPVVSLSEPSDEVSLESGPPVLSRDTWARA